MRARNLFTARSRRLAAQQRVVDLVGGANAR